MAGLRLYLNGPAVAIDDMLAKSQTDAVSLSAAVFSVFGGEKRFENIFCLIGRNPAAGI